MKDPAAVARVIASAERHEAQTYRALRAGLAGLQRDVRVLMADAAARPVTMVMASVRGRVVRWSAETVTAVMSARSSAAAAGGLVVAELGAATEATEDLAALESDRVTVAVETIGGQLQSALLAEAVLVAGGEQETSGALAAIGSTLVGSAIFSRAAERLTGLASAEMGDAWGAEAQRRGSANLQKRWALGSTRNHRDSHVAASRRPPIPWKARFSVGGFPTPYPRGPGLPASETRHCSCRLVPVAPATT